MGAVNRFSQEQRRCPRCLARSLLLSRVQPFTRKGQSGGGGGGGGKEKAFPPALLEWRVRPRPSFPRRVVTHRRRASASGGRPFASRIPGRNSFFRQIMHGIDLEFALLKVLHYTQVITVLYKIVGFGFRMIQCRHPPLHHSTLQTIIPLSDGRQLSALNVCRPSFSIIQLHCIHCSPA